jgi:CO dehydrogenase/acetyl-CoA synthase beta subunit
MRGQPKAFVQIKYKGNRDDEFIPPDSLDKSFKDNNVATDSTLNLVEMRNFHMPAEDSDAPAEEGEEEHEEMEEEIEENQPLEEPPLDKKDTTLPAQHTMPNVVESKP